MFFGGGMRWHNAYGECDAASSQIALEYLVVHYANEAANCLNVMFGQIYLVYCLCFTVADSHSIYYQLIMSLIIKKPY